MAKEFIDIKDLSTHLKFKKVIDIKELSSYLKISIPEIRKLIRESDIPHFRIRSAIRFDLIEINKWIENLEKKEQEKVLYY